MFSLRTQGPKGGRQKESPGAPQAAVHTRYSVLKVNYIKESLHILYKIKGIKGTVITVCVYIEVFLPSVII